MDGHGVNQIWKIPTMDILQIPIHNIILKIGQVVQDLLFEIML